MEQARHARVVSARIQAESSVRLREKARRGCRGRRFFLARPLRGPAALLVLVDGVEAAIGVPQVRVGALLALRVGQRRLRVRRREVGRLEVRGRRVAQRGSRGVRRRLVEGRELREATAGGGPVQPIRAVLVCGGGTSKGGKGHHAATPLEAQKTPAFPRSKQRPSPGLPVWRRLPEAPARNT